METVCSTPPAPAAKSPPQDVVLWILGVSLLLGIAADVLLRCLPFGINVTLFVGLLCLALAWGWRRHREETPCWHILGVMFLLSLGLAWRDTPVLHTLNLLAIVMLLVLLSARPSRHALGTTTLATLGCNMFCGAAQASTAPVSLFGRETDWAQTAKVVRTDNARRILRGLAFAVPLLVVFTLLFTKADAVFKHMVETTGAHLSDLLIENQYLARHVLFSLVFSFLATFLIRPVTLGAKWEAFDVPTADSWRPGSIELAIAMGSVLLLFLAFVAIQFRYLFGGDRLVLTIPGLTYATYARKGFFALLGVVFVVHILLTLGAWLVQEADPRTQRLYRGLGLALMALTAFLFASAFFRMHLYVQAYGLTRLRFYAVGILLWLAVVFLILVVRLLRPHASFFTSGNLYSILVMLLVLNAVNPDGLIARVNLERLAKGRDLDLEYLERLSTDAVPVILRYQDHLSAQDRDHLLDEILHNRMEQVSGWRSWNYSRAQTLRQLSGYRLIRQD